MKKLIIKLLLLIVPTLINAAVIGISPSSVKVGETYTVGYVNDTPIKSNASIKVNNGSVDYTLAHNNDRTRWKYNFIAKYEDGNPTNIKLQKGVLK